MLSKRDQINEVLRTKLDEITEHWGGKITRVEIREITPPRDIHEAMNRMLSAERTRRAVITESEGARQSAINVAEGQKQSEILKAEGERQAAILRAEGFSEALTRIFNAAHGRRPEDDDAAVPRGAEGARGRARRRSTSSRSSSPGWLEPISDYIEPVVGGSGRASRSATDGDRAAAQAAPPPPAPRRPRPRRPGGPATRLPDRPAHGTNGPLTTGTALGTLRWGTVSL